MSGSIFNSQEEVDPWASGWNDHTGSNSNHTINNDKPSVGPSQFPSMYLTSSQLLDKKDESNSRTMSNVPQSYEALHSELLNKLNTITDLEYHVLDKLVSLDYLTNYQKSKLMDAVYDNNLLPISLAQNVYQIFGLIALEIDVPGSGDYVTLQFKLNSLPELPEKLVKLVKREQEQGGVIDDPLMANSSRKDEQDDDAGDWNRENAVDPILTDHSASQHVLSGDTDEHDHDHDHEHGHGRAPPLPVDTKYIEKYIADIRDEFKPLVLQEDLIKIKEVPEKEGLLFKHINYIISHNLTLGSGGLSGPKKVVRRYSDFAWFLNQLIKHPVLKEEPIVQSFLTVPTDLSTWKKQAKIDNSLEFKGQKIQTDFINTVWPAVSEEFLKNWAVAEQNIKHLIEKWTKVVVIVERHERRQQQISFDNQKLVEILGQFRRLDVAVYPLDDKSTFLQNDDIESINSGLGTVGEYYTKASQIIVDDSYIINTKTLEKFKNYMDYLYSLQELFERSKTLSGNEIEILNKRIRENETRFKKLNTDGADVTNPDITRLRQMIINDKQEIFQQLNKDWLIKQCCFKEFLMFQETQYLISEVWLEWTRDRFKFQEKMTALFDNVNTEVQDHMPLSR
ncbi:uncharacterized protein LODBEIA_P58340 [Lodderomyces beijingensis]|uniref:Sorting nexin 8/Mvp1 BAR domain-containing protein n=1 Tax=Lodderomyces beijingensis TaxID=1775926 RepID=A0ABP0ZX47_9ASCO